ncbi:hypothetical protein [Absidia glauca]|uniref:Uncharacterized protein n=1 Tax=Absidia glauca TaxID=4829 RepID=A0A168R0I7_ABSGL|nr:hypothetical protein [Absidia glauca]
MQNTTTTPVNHDIKMVDASLSPLEKAKQTVAKLEVTTHDLCAQVDATSPDGTAFDDILLACTAAADRLDRAKAMYLRLFPNEPMFGGAKTSDAEADIKTEDIPGLKTEADEDLPMAKVYLAAKPFVDHFEKLFILKKVNINDVYPRYLEWSLGSAYRKHVAKKRGELAPGSVETWEMAKEWLLKFKDTPANRWKNLQALVKLEVEYGESSDDLHHRLSRDFERLGAEKFTAAEVLLASALRSAPHTWSGKLHDTMEKSITKGPMSLNDALQMLSSIGLVSPRPDKRKDAGSSGSAPSVKRFSRDRGSSSSSSSRPAPTGHHGNSSNSSNTSNTSSNGTGKLCAKRGCGAPYTDDHNELRDDQNTSKPQNKNGS